MEIRRGHRRIMTVIVTLFVLAVLIVGGTLGYFWYKKAHTNDSSNTTAQSGGSIAINTKAKLETEDLQTALVIPGPNDKPGDKIQISTLSITAPKAWRTTNVKTILNTNEQSSAYITAANDVLAQLVMVPEKNPTDPLQAINGFSVYNTTNWLKQPVKSNGGQTVTAAMKAAWIANLEALGNGQAANPAACKNGAGVFDVSLCSPLLHSTPITTKDGSLKGIAFIDKTAQAVSYDPRTVIFLTGEVKGQRLLAYGTFHLLDNASHTLSVDDTAGVKAAWDSLVAGTIPADTEELYQHVINAVKSVTIQAN